MFVVDALKGLLRPSGCLACGVPAAWPCCADCLPSEPGAVGPWALAADPDLPLWTLGPYRDGLRTAVLAGKLDGQPAALTELGRRLGTAMAGAGAGADLVTYVAAGRVAGPPRDHAERIATGVATALDLPLAHLLAPAGGRDLGRARRAEHAPARHPAHLRQPAAASPAAGSCWSTTSPPPAAPSPPRPTTLRTAGARQVEAAVLAASPSALGRGPSPLDPARRPDVRPAGRPVGGGRPLSRPLTDLPCSRRSHCVVVTRFRV